jgi:RNA polymerase sigma-70 factor (ECF subfamily)
MVVECALDGDEAAVERLLVIVRTIVVRYCRACLGRQQGSFASADAVAHQVCTAVLRKLPLCRTRGRSLLTLVHDTAARMVGGRPPGTGVAGLLPSLSFVQRETLVLRMAVGLSVESTAEALGSGVGPVRLAERQALERLRGHVPRS